jgi:hypothetical protein
LHFPVEQRDRDEGNAEEDERAVDFAKFDTGNAAERGTRVEDVRKDAADYAEGVFGGVDRDGAFLAKIVGTQIVEAQDMVGVAMREDHGVQAIDVCAEGLRAKVGAGVDDDVLAGAGEEERRAEALVAWIERFADGAAAAE